jgi:hypothetical protein
MHTHEGLTIRRQPQRARTDRSCIRWTAGLAGYTVVVGGRSDMRAPDGTETQSMPLRSLWFVGNERLGRCLSSDPQHVKPGDQGTHVQLIQGALRILDDIHVDEHEASRAYYGRSTAQGVLAYKRKRHIVNRAYQLAADDIVGRQTIESLDGDMLAKQEGLHFAAVGVPFVRSFLFAPILQKTVKCVVVSETNASWFRWAKQFEAKFKPVGMGEVVTIANVGSVADVAGRLKLAATLAGPRGFLVLSVGHGGEGHAGQNNEGNFDLGPHYTFRVGGQNSWLIGQPKPTNARAHALPAHVDAFYDFRLPNPIVAGGFEKSRKDLDEADGDAAARTRLANWAHYADLGNSFRSLSGIILMTCRVGGSSLFLQRVHQQWGCPIVAYPRRVYGVVNEGRARVYLEGDAPGTGTNTQLGEFLFPLSRDMGVF